MFYKKRITIITLLLLSSFALMFTTCSLEGDFGEVLYNAGLISKYGYSPVQSTNGRLTITGIPSEYNGYYAYSFDNEYHLYAADNIYASGNYYFIYAGRISSGSVTLKVWRWEWESGLKFRNYDGYDNISFTVGIYDNNEVASININTGEGNNYHLTYSGNVTVNFSNGQGTGTWGY
jgi:hypothetical protein